MKEDKEIKLDIPKLDAKAKRLVRKDSLSTCAYVYRDGIVVETTERHTYKGEIFSKEKRFTFPAQVGISVNNSKEEPRFIGRLVFHNPTLLLDGIDHIRIYRNNKSQNMEKMNITCDTVTIKTLSGMQIHENIYGFMSSDTVIQNTHNMSIKDFEKEGY